MRATDTLGASAKHHRERILASAAIALKRGRAVSAARNAWPIITASICANKPNTAISSATWATNALTLANGSGR